MVVLIVEISKNNTTQFELEQLKRRVRMLNLGTTSLDHILGMGKSSKECGGLGYMKGSSGTQATVWIGAQDEPSVDPTKTHTEI